MPSSENDVNIKTDVAEREVIEREGESK